MNPFGELWIVVADERIARIFRKEKTALALVRTLTDDDIPDPNLTNQTIGRGATPGAGHHGYEPSMTESRQKPIKFARRVVEYIEKGAGKEFSRLVIVAAPWMLGELRNQMEGGAAEKFVIGETAMEIAPQDEKILIKELRKLIPGPDFE